MFTLLFRSVCLKSRYLKGVQKCNHQLIWVIAGLRFEACLNPQRGVIIGKKHYVETSANVPFSKALNHQFPPSGAAE